MRLWRALTHNRAETHPDHEDPRLRGRSYAIPFREVWESALETAGRMRGWTTTAADPQSGEIEAEARTTLWRFVDDVRIRVSLDDTGMTRVELTSASRVGRGDLGANARRIARFLHRLDRRLARRGPGTTESDPRS